MIDWLTLSTDPLNLPDSQRIALYATRSHIIKLTPEQYNAMRHGKTVSPEWDAPERIILRSDDNQITVSLGALLTLSGSPARVDQTHNVFGSSDIQECAAKMINFASEQLGLCLPVEAFKWSCTRLDYNNTFVQDSPAAVRQILTAIAQLTPRQAKTTKGSTVAFGSRRSNFYLKFYDKGLHLKGQLRRLESSLSVQDQVASDSLLRTEITFNARQLSTMGKWWSITQAIMQEFLEARIQPLLGGLMINNTNRDVFQLLFEYYRSERVARNLYQVFNHITTIGFENYKNSVPSGTFYHNKKRLFDAGISYIDFSPDQKVVRIKREPLNLGERAFDFDEVRQIRLVMNK